MKRLSFYLFALMLASACGNNSHKADAQDKDDESTDVADDSVEAAAGDAHFSVAPLQLQTVAYASDDSMVVLNVEVPVSGGTCLTDSIIEYIGENIESLSYFYNQTKNTRKAVMAAGKNLTDSLSTVLDEMKAEFASDEDESFEYMFVWQQTREIKKIAENDRFVTFVMNGYSYEGGAHGFNWCEGTTFDKVTGERIGHDILRNTDSDAFKKMFRTELLKYFEPASGERLEDYLLIPIDSLKLSNMSLTDSTFIFQYQPYEISYYAAGAPAAVLTFKQMKPYLTKNGLRLIGE